MVHRMLGRAHAELAWWLAPDGAFDGHGGRRRRGARGGRRGPRGQRGQGTVEYVALMLLVAALLTAVVAVAKGVKGDGIAGAIVEKLKDTIDGVGSKR